MFKFLYKKFCYALLDFLEDDNERCNANIRNFLYRSLGMNIEKNVYISKKSAFLNPQNIHLKSYTSIGQYNQLQAFDKITIGEYCMFATNITIIAGTHYNDDFRPKDNQDVTVGAGTWIGANVTILGGVTIGKGCIIGTGSVVNKDIPDYSIAVGVPCKVIKKRIPSQRIWYKDGFYNLSKLERLTTPVQEYGEHIPIFLASDDKYAPFLCTTLLSILDNTLSYIDFYILDGGISHKSKTKIEKTLKDFQNYSVEYIDMSKYALNRFPNCKHYSLNTFSRYFIPELKPDLEKALYMDVDVIVKNDIKHLFDTDLENYPIGAVPEDFHGENEKYLKNNIYPDWRGAKPYFNAGILLLNIKKLKADNYSEKFINKTIELASKLSCPDQDVFNILFENNYQILDYKFNYMPDFQNLYEQKLGDIAKELPMQSHIVHYTCFKPWKFKECNYSEFFWDMMKETLFYKQIYKYYCRKILKVTLIKQIFSVTNEKEHKLIRLLGFRFKFKRKNHG